MVLTKEDVLKEFHCEEFYPITAKIIEDAEEVHKREEVFHSRDEVIVDLAVQKGIDLTLRVLRKKKREKADG